MMYFQIDDIRIEAAHGTTIMQAARTAGIEIPHMCYREGYHNHPSCMICVVKDKRNGRLLPSCAIPAEEGMDIITMDEEIREARREALELLMSEHVGDCEAPCRTACPAFMDIPQMNRLIAAGKFEEAINIVKQEIALPLVLGYVCSAPCEKVCRRAQIDEAVAICQLKKFSSAQNISYQKDKKSPTPKTGKRVAIAGSGPAGLACAWHLAQLGHEVVIFEKEPKAGGSLLKVSGEILPAEMLQKEIEIIRAAGVTIKTGEPVNDQNFEGLIRKNYDAVVLAAGASDALPPDFPALEFHATGIVAHPETYETHLPGVFACGSIIRKQKMAVKAVAQGKEAAFSVDRFLAGNKPEPVVRRFNSRFGKLMEEEFGAYLNEAVPDGKTVPHAGNLQGYDPDEARAEAARCMYCDCRKPDTCKLRLYADEYHIERNKYASPDRQPVIRHITHRDIVFEPGKCIRCGLCIDIAGSAKDLPGLTFVGRGFDVRIEMPFGEKIENALHETALLCAEACPTGAISKKKNNL